MIKHKFEQAIQQLEKRKGGYFYLKIDAEIINQYEKKRHTRLVCTLDGTISYSCGLNHLGDGNFFIIVATKYLTKLGKSLGDKLTFEIHEDPNPLGVEIPEVLLVLLEQDAQAKETWEAITDGKKRSLIYTIMKVKNIDKQVDKALAFLHQEAIKLHAKKS